MIMQNLSRGIGMILNFLLCRKEKIQMVKTSIYDKKLEATSEIYL